MKTPSQMVLFRVDGMGIYKAHCAIALINDTFQSRAEFARGIFDVATNEGVITQLRLKSGACVLFGEFGSLEDSLTEDQGNYFDSVGYTVFKDEAVIAEILAEIEANTRDSFDQAPMDVTDLVFNGTSFRLGGVEKYDTGTEIETPWVELWEVGLAPAPQEAVEA